MSCVGEAFLKDLSESDLSKSYLEIKNSKYNCRVPLYESIFGRNLLSNMMSTVELSEDDTDSDKIRDVVTSGWDPYAGYVYPAMTYVKAGTHSLFELGVLFTIAYSYVMSDNFDGHDTFDLDNPGDHEVMSIRVVLSNGSAHEIELTENVIYTQISPARIYDTFMLSVKNPRDIFYPLIKQGWGWLSHEVSERVEEFILYRSQTYFCQEASVSPFVLGVRAFLHYDDAKHWAVRDNPCIVEVGDVNYRIWVEEVERHDYPQRIFSINDVVKVDSIEDHKES